MGFLNREHGFADHFADGRVREYELLYIRNSLLTRNHCCRAVDDLRRIAADHVYAEDVLMFLAVYDLDNAIAAFVFRDVSAGVPE